MLTISDAVFRFLCSEVYLYEKHYLTYTRGLKSYE